MKWMEVNTPNVMLLRRKLTEQEFLKLHEKYSYQQIFDILQQMENHKDLGKKYVSVYLTINNWARREYGG